MAYHIPHHANKTKSPTGLVLAPFFTFAIPSGAGRPDVQPDVIFKDGSLSLVTDPFTYFDICARYPNLWLHILDGRNKLITILVNQYRVFSSTSAALRVAQFLYVLSYEMGLPQGRVTLDISQSEIAEALSISRMSVAKSLAKLYDLHIASSGYKTITIDTVKLVRYINSYNMLATEDQIR